MNRGKLAILVSWTICSVGILLIAGTGYIVDEGLVTGLLRLALVLGAGLLITLPVGMMLMSLLFLFLETARGWVAEKTR